MTDLYETAANFLSADGLNSKADIAEMIASGETFRSMAEEMISGWDLDATIEDATAAIEQAYENWSD